MNWMKIFVPLQKMGKFWVSNCVIWAKVRIIRHLRYSYSGNMWGDMWGRNNEVRIEAFLEVPLVTFLEEYFMFAQKVFENTNQKCIDLFS